MSRFGINDISIIQSRGIFFDTNVLIYLFGDAPPDWKKDYTKIFSKILSQGNKCYVDMTVLSEFINVWFRTAYTTSKESEKFTLKPK